MIENIPYRVRIAMFGVVFIKRGEKGVFLGCFSSLLQPTRPFGFAVGGTRAESPLVTELPNPAGVHVDTKGEISAQVFTQVCRTLVGMSASVHVNSACPPVQVLL